MREVPFVPKADDLALAMSHLAQFSSAYLIELGGRFCPEFLAASSRAGPAPLAANGRNRRCQDDRHPVVNLGNQLVGVSGDDGECANSRRLWLLRHRHDFEHIVTYAAG